jgi:CheY-like chemotaxis protein
MSPAERGKTVLVVEDNQLERQGLSALLQQAGYSVISAADGKEVWTACKADRLQT